MHIFKQLITPIIVTSLSLLSIGCSDSNHGNSNADASVPIPIKNNVAPVASLDNIEVNDRELTGDINLLDNDSDADDDSIAITNYSVNFLDENKDLKVGETFSLDSLGNITVSADGHINVQLVDGYLGELPTITYIVSDGKSEAIGRVNLINKTVNKAPEINVDKISINSGEVLGDQNVLTNDKDINNDTLLIEKFSVDTEFNGTYTSFMPGESAIVNGIGRFSITQNGTVQIELKNGYIGKLPQLKYTVTDGINHSEGLVNISNNTPNAAPTAVEDIIKVNGNSIIGNANILKNDSDINEDSLSVIEFELTTDNGRKTVQAGETILVDNIGSFSIGSDGKTSINLIAGYIGNLPKINYTVTDGSDISKSEVNLVNETPNTSPSLLKDNISKDGGSITGDLNVLANDIDINRDSITVESFAVDINGDGVNEAFEANETANIDNIGTISINKNGVVTLAFDENYVGSIPVLTYIVSDGKSTSESQLVINNYTENKAPVLNADTVSTDGTNLTGDINVLNNDSDIIGEDISVISFEVDTNSDNQNEVFKADDIAQIDNVGEFSLSSEGSITLNLNEGYIGSIPVVNYTVSDGELTSSSTVTINNNTSNSVPVLTEDNISTDGSSLTGDTNILSNDKDINNQILAIESFSLDTDGDGKIETFNVGNTANIENIGSVKIDADGELTFSINQNYTGKIPVISYVVSDGNAASTSSVIITNNTPNSAPTATEDSVTKNKRQFTGDLNVLSNDTDLNNDDLIVKTFFVDTDNDATNESFAAGELANIEGVGNLSVSENGDLSFLIEENYIGSIPSIEYLISDGTATARSSIIITNETPNVAPNANSDVVMTDGTDLSGNINVLDNDNDPNNQPLTVVSFKVDGINNVFDAGVEANIDKVGAFTISSKGEITLLLNQYYTGNIPTVEYTVSDGITSATSNIAIVNKTSNSAPILKADTISVDGLTLSGNINVLSNDSDFNNDNLSVVSFEVDTDGDNSNEIFTAGSFAQIDEIGQIKVNADGLVLFELINGYTGSIPVVNYSVTDGKSYASNNLTFKNITSNTAPTAKSDQIVFNGIDLSGDTNILDNDSDINNQKLIIESYSIDVNNDGKNESFNAGDIANIVKAGSLKIGSNGELTFDFNQNYTGDIPLITYFVSDGNSSSTSTINIINNTPNTKPVANSDVVTKNKSQYTGDLNVLLNDTDVNNDSLIVTTFKVDTNNDNQKELFNAGEEANINAVGSISIAKNGKLTFTIDKNFIGSIPSLEYFITDGETTAESSITINNDTPNVSPIVNPDVVMTNGTDLSGNINVLANDSDPNNQPLSIAYFKVDGITKIYRAGQVAPIDNVGNFTISNEGDISLELNQYYRGNIPAVEYTVSDGITTSTSTLGIINKTSNSAPQLQSDTLNTIGKINTGDINVLANDSDPNGDSISVTKFAVDINGDGIDESFVAGVTANIEGVGSVTLNSTGDVVTDINEFYLGGVPVITYSVSDGESVDTSQLNIINVTPNTVPTLVEDHVATDGLILTGDINVLANDSDVNNQDLEVDSFSLDTDKDDQKEEFNAGNIATITDVGTFSIDREGNINFSVKYDYTGSIPEITYTVTDGKDTSTSRIIIENNLPSETMDQRILAVQQNLNDPSIPFATKKEYEESEFGDKTQEEIAEERRINNLLTIAQYAEDPDPAWISTLADESLLVVEPGNQYSVNLTKRDANNEYIGPVDPSLLRFEIRIQHSEDDIEYIPSEYHANYVNWDQTIDGKLNVSVPTTLGSGRLIVGIRPDVEDYGQRVLTERWSTVLTFEAWQPKAGVTSLNEEEVQFPKFDANDNLLPTNEFTVSEIQNEAKKYLDEFAVPVPLVVKGNKYNKGDLIDYMLGQQPYAGRVQIVINKNDEQLLILSPEIVEVYDILIGNNDIFKDIGVAPENVVYRGGTKLNNNNAIGNDAEYDPIKYFGPSDRAQVQGNGDVAFKVECAGSAGNNISDIANIVVTPTIEVFSSNPYIDLTGKADMNLNFVGKVECKAELEYKVSISSANPVARIVEKVTGSALVLTYTNSGKIGISANAGTTRATISGGARLGALGNLRPHADISLHPTGGGGSGLEGEPMQVKAWGGVETGVKLEAALIEIKQGTALSLMGKVLNMNYADFKISAFVSGTASLYGSINGYNAAQVYSSGGASNRSADVKGALNLGVSPGFSKILKYFGFKYELKVDITGDTNIFKEEAGFTVEDVDDSGSGSASAYIIDTSSSKSANQGYASLSDSSVFNDRNLSIGYDVQECKDRGGRINTPFVACSNSFWCAKAEGTAELCPGTVRVRSVSASGTEGDTVSDSTTVTLKGGSSNIDPDKVFNVSISGGPLSPSTSSISLKAGTAQTVSVSTTCPSRGAHRGTISASSNGSTDTRTNVVTCKCKKGTPGCDETWADPHILTGDGLAYDYIATGDYIMQRIVDENNQTIDGLEVQARFLPGFEVSWPQATAVKVGSDIIEVYSNQYNGGGNGSNFQNVLYIKINGQLQGPLHQWGAIKDGSRTIKLPSGGMIYFDSFAGVQRGEWDPTSLTILWPESSQFEHYGLIVSTPSNEGRNNVGMPLLDLQFVRPEDFSGQERGLMGNNDGNPNNDFIRRNGQIMDTETTSISWTQLYGLFGGDWLVKGSECLFSDGCIQKPDFPTSAIELSPEQRAMAETACFALKGYYKEACIHDVGLSGDVEIVKAYYSNTDDLNEMADQIVTPGSVGNVVYMANWSRSDEIDRIYNINAEITHVAGEGKYLLVALPPKGGSVSINDDLSLISQVDNGNSQQHTIEVDCKTPDQRFNDLPLGAFGHAQLWSVDPLSGFADKLLSETRLSCDTGVRMVAGDDHKLLLDDEGQLWAWGSNAKGQLGNGGINDSNSTPELITLPDTSYERITNMAAGAEHTIVLDNNGQLWAWGDNTYGQLGNGSNVYDVPTKVDMSEIKADGGSIIAISAGRYHSLALDDKGGLWAWGRNNYGQLGINNNVNKTVPTRVSTTDITGRIIKIDSGNDHNIILNSEGKIWTWGHNSHGQLGNGEIGLNLSSLEPIELDLTPLGNAQPITIASGANHNLILDSNNNLWSMGANADGQLGNNGISNEDSPVLVKVDMYNIDQSSPLYRITAAGNHNVVVDANSGIYTWGNNKNGQLGLGNQISINQPTRMDIDLQDNADLISVDAGKEFTIFLDSNGYVYATGNDGINSTSKYTDKASPGIIAKLSGEPEYSNYDVEVKPNSMAVLDNKMTLGKITGRIIMPLGKTDEIMLVETLEDNSKNSETLELTRTQDFDFNIKSQCLSYGNHANTYELFDSNGESLSTNPVSVGYVCYPDLSSKIRVDQDTGNVYVYVTNESRLPVQPYLNHATSDWNPVLNSNETKFEIFESLNCNQTANFTGSVTIDTQVLENNTPYYSEDIIFYPMSSCGDGMLSAGFANSMALSSKGNVWAWGNNHDGQLGIGSTNDANVPTAIKLQNIFDKNIVDFASGSQHTLMLDGDTNEIWAWGSNSHGQIGNNEGGFGEYESQPVKVIQDNIGDEKIVDLSAGYSHSLALDSKGQIWAWGSNLHNELGIQSSIEELVPVATDMSNITNSKIIAVEAGLYHSIALDDNGNVWAWGFNNYKQLGNSTVDFYRIPTKVDLSAVTSSGATVTQIAVGHYFNLALDSNGQLWAWGVNSKGQLGDGTFTDSVSPIKVDMQSMPNDVSIKLITSDTNHSLVLYTNGELWGWGDNRNGALGSSVLGKINTPVQVSQANIDSKILNIAIGGDHSLALDSFGQIWSWGQNKYGQLGRSSDSIAATPGKVNMTQIERDNQTP